MEVYVNYSLPKRDFGCNEVGPGPHGSESGLTKISRMTGNKVDSPLEARGRLA